MNALTSIRNVAFDANVKLSAAIADFRAARAELLAAHENSEAARIAWAAVSRDPDDDVVRRGNELSLEAVKVLNPRIEKGDNDK